MKRLLSEPTRRHHWHWEGHSENLLATKSCEKDTINLSLPGGGKITKKNIKYKKEKNSLLSWSEKKYVKL